MSRYYYQHAFADGSCDASGKLTARQVCYQPLLGFPMTNVYPVDSVRHIVLDEADRMLDTEFLEQVQEVIAACTHPDVQKAVFSATLPANAEKIAMGMLRDPIRVVVGLK